MEQAGVHGDATHGEQSGLVQVEPGGFGIDHRVAGLEMGTVEHRLGKCLPGLQGLLGLCAERLAATRGLEAG